MFWENAYSLSGFRRGDQNHFHVYKIDMKLQIESVVFKLFLSCLLSLAKADITSINH